MLRIAIDGACRRNGKPDCVSSGGIFIAEYTNDGLSSTSTRGIYEYESTNQRGELLALRTALDAVQEYGQDAQIITDSEYIFNTMTKGWLNTWVANGWKSSSGAPVKNKHIWAEIYKRITTHANASDIAYYHIKGHCISVGAVTANKLLSSDSSGRRLYDIACSAYDEQYTRHKELLDTAQALSAKNNGFVLTDSILKSFVVMNTVADKVANKYVDEADINRLLE